MSVLLYLVRHGETDANRERRVQGWGDHSLNAQGRSQAQAVASYLAGQGLQALYTSPLLRARETAQVVAQAVGIEPIVDPGLAEVNAGELDGLTFEEMASRYPDFRERWSQDMATTRMPGGETLQELQDRALAAVQGMASRHGGETVATVSHNFTILAILCWALGIPLHSFRRLRQDTGAISVIRLDDATDPVVSLLNYVYSTETPAG